MEENSKIKQLIELGKIAVDAGDHEALLKYSTEIIDNDPKNPFGWYFKAEYFISRATYGNMQVDGYTTSMKQAFINVVDNSDKYLLMNRVIDNITGHLYGLLNAKVGENFTSTLDSVYIGAFTQLVRIKKELNPYIISDETTVIEKLQLALTAYGSFRSKFPFNATLNSPETKEVFEKGIPQNIVESSNNQTAISSGTNAIGIVILGILGFIALVWWIGWGIFW